MHLPKSLVLSVAFAGLSFSAAVMANDWVHYGSDLSSTKYAPFDQINHGNVSSLQLAWSWNSPDNATVAANHAAENFRATPGAYKSTPIAINGILYISTSFGRVAAIDGVSGEELWVFDTRSWEAGRPANLGYNHRGVGYWSEGGQERITSCAFSNSSRTTTTSGTRRSAVVKDPWHAPTKPLSAPRRLVMDEAVLYASSAASRPPPPSSTPSTSPRVSAYCVHHTLTYLRSTRANSTRVNSVKSNIPKYSPLRMHEEVDMLSVSA
jgi:outer membrane protein assembly factor BamB